MLQSMMGKAPHPSLLEVLQQRDKGHIEDIAVWHKAAAIKTLFITSIIQSVVTLDKRGSNQSDCLLRNFWRNMKNIQNNHPCS